MSQVLSFLLNWVMETWRIEDVLYIVLTKTTSTLSCYTFLPLT